MLKTRRRIWLRLLIAICLFWGTDGGGTGALRAAEPAKLATGTELGQLLNQPLMVTWDFARLQDILARLSEERRVGILLDRRLDPTQLVLADLKSPYFDSGIAELVNGFGGATLVGETLFVAPTGTAATFQTRLFLAEQSLENVLGKDLARKLELSRRMEFRWEKGASPRGLLAGIAARYHLTVENPDAIPYDQWRAGLMARPNAAEALLLITTQFGQELKWVGRDRVQLVPEAPTPVLQQEHILRGITATAAVERIKTHFPDLAVTSVAKKLIVTGLQEEQLQVAVLLGNRPARKAAINPSTASLANRRFTLKMNNSPFVSLMHDLEKQGIEIRWNAETMREAGINLEKPISLTLEQATIEQLLDAACHPLGIAYKSDGSRIDLSPRQP